MNRSVPVLIVVALLIGGCVDSRPEQANDTGSGVTVSALQAPHVTDSGDQKPPPLEIGTSAERVEVPGYDYTWGADDSEMGVSADSFGREEPTPLTVDTSTVPVQWIDGAVLSASVSLEGDKCDTPLLEPSGPGEWVLAMPPAPGTYRVGFYGTSGRWKSLFAIMLTSTVEGPPLTPHAEVWWPDTIDRFQPYVEIAGPPDNATMTLRVSATGADATTLVLDRVPPSEHPQSCPPTFRIGDETPFSRNTELPGNPPYTISLLVESPEGDYEASWRWPDDLNPTGKLVGSMTETSS